MGSVQRAKRSTRTVSGVFAYVLWFCFASLPAAQVPLRDLNDKPVDPLRAGSSAKASVFVFTSTDCPISNRYAPEIRRIYEKFAAQGVAFWLVYPNRADSPAAIREHLKAYSYPMEALRDPQHALVKRTKVTVTPEAVVFDSRGRITYRGRIDDRYVDVSRQRPAATKHDLEDALGATLARQPVRAPSTQAVGCFIADFQPLPLCETEP